VRNEPQKDFTVTLKEVVASMRLRRDERLFTVMVSGSFRHLLPPLLQSP